MDLQTIIKKIRTKNWKNLDENIVLEKLQDILNKDKKLAEQFPALNEKSAAVKELIKRIKQSLHYSYGSFQKDVSKRDKLLEKLKTADSKEFLELHKKIMLTHASTQERSEIYETLYDDLFSVTEIPSSILDIGCGLNPFSLPWMKLKELRYFASEFNKDDLAFIEKYFALLRKMKQFEKYELKTVLIDLQKNYEKIKEIKTEIIFAWKLFDIINTATVEHIVKNANAKFLIASFSTKTLGKRHMTSPRRAGFQKMLRRLNLQYQTKTYPNEIFYIIRLQ